MESSIGQEIKSLEGKIAKHKFDISKLHGPLNKVQRLVVAKEKECDWLEKEVTCLRVHVWGTSLVHLKWLVYHVACSQFTLQKRRPA